MTSPNATVSRHCSAVKYDQGLAPDPAAHGDVGQPAPTGKPMMPAPALNAAMSAERPNDECAASATIETDQNEKNHRFHSTAMNAKLMSMRSRERSTVLWNLWFFSFWSVSIVADAAHSSFGRSALIAAFNAGAGIIGFPVGGWLSDVAVRRGHRPQAAWSWPSPRCSAC